MAPHWRVVGPHQLYRNAGLWVDNSRGTGWGLNGYAELSWDYVLDNVWLVETIEGVWMTPGV